MEDEKSTPISSLNNKGDDSEVVNQILSKYNSLGSDGQQQQGGGGMPQETLPPLNRNIPQMEQQFENRNLNEELYQLNSKNIAYEDHYKKELNRVNKNDDNQEGQEYYDEDAYDEYEIEEVPLWRRVLNELRIPIYIFIFILIFFNCSFDKFLIGKIPILGNQFNECNTYGILSKAFLVSLLSYLLIRFLRV